MRPELTSHLILGTVLIPRAVQRFPAEAWLPCKWFAYVRATSGDALRLPPAPAAWPGPGSHPYRIPPLGPARPSPIPGCTHVGPPWPMEHSWHTEGSAWHAGREREGQGRWWERSFHILHTTLSTVVWAGVLLGSPFAPTPHLPLSHSPLFAPPPVLRSFLPRNSIKPKGGVRRPPRTFHLPRPSLCFLSLVQHSRVVNLKTAGIPPRGNPRQPHPQRIGLGYGA